jgi:hypothetical protein
MLPQLDRGSSRHSTRLRFASFPAVTEARAALAVERVGGRDGAGGGGTRYEYIAITDHSKGLKIAGGINEEHATKRGQLPPLMPACDQKGRPARLTPLAG